MKNFAVIVLLIGLMISGCSGTGHKEITVNDNGQSKSADSQQIINLVKRMYKWHETDPSKNDMVCLTDARDSIYVGVDLEKQKLRAKELRNTGLFSEEFIANDYKISETIDGMLRNGAYGDPWLVGDLPPFGSDANAWCNCQDVPNDTAWWNEIKFRFISLDSANATLTWAWIDTIFDKSKSEYKVKVVKTNGAWKISYLQGFDFEKFVGKNY